MREKYESLSLATLKDLAKARGLKGISTLRKPELIERMLQEDEKESIGGEAEMKKTEILQEEPGRQENRVRENRTSYEANERKTYQDKNYQDRNYQERNYQDRNYTGRNMHIRIRPIRHSLTVEKKQMVFWRSFRTDMDLFAVQIISQVKMIFMYHRLRYAGSI